MATRPLPFPAPALTDPDSLPAIRRGDPDALGALYDHRAPAILLLARRLLGSAAEAEDLVQDLFVGLPEALAHYQERGSLGPWLRTVATRMALMRLRRRRTRAACAWRRLQHAEPRRVHCQLGSTGRLRESVRAGRTRCRVGGHDRLRSR